MMKAVKIHVGLVFAITIAILASGAALCQAQGEEQQIKVKVEMKAGDEVTLFYGGTGDIKAEFPVGAEMGVYSRNQAFGLNMDQKIGRVKITGYGGENFVKAQVVEGTIGPGDVVKLKPGVACAAMVCPPLQRP